MSISQYKTEIQFCKRCFAPIQNREYCDSCWKIKRLGLNKVKRLFRQEFKRYINSKTGSKILFAYSGGEDSTACLYLLSKICQKKDIELHVIFLDHGFKSHVTLENVRKVIDYLSLQRNFTYLDISVKKIPPQKNCVYSLYLQKTNHLEFPCGSYCRRILNFFFKKHMYNLGVHEIVTGGNYPSEKGNIPTIFRESQRNVIFVESALGFNLTKRKIRKIISKLPWEDPKNGGYDSDCMIPGFLLHKLFPARHTSLTELYRKAPLVLGYFSSCVRYGFLKKKDVLKELSCLDLPSKHRLLEFKEKILKFRKH